MNGRDAPPTLSHATTGCLRADATLQQLPVPGKTPRKEIDMLHSPRSQPGGIRKRFVKAGAPGCSLSQKRREREDWSALLASSGTYGASKNSDVIAGSFQQSSGFMSSQQSGGSSGSRATTAPTGNGPSAWSVADARKCADNVLGLLQSPRDIHESLQKAAAEAQKRAELERVLEKEKAAAKEQQTARLAKGTASSERRTKDMKKGSQSKRKDKDKEDTGESDTKGSDDDRKGKGQVKGKAKPKGDDKGQPSGEDNADGKTTVAVGRVESKSSAGPGTPDSQQSSVRRKSSSGGDIESIIAGQKSGAKRMSISCRNAMIGDHESHVRMHEHHVHPEDGDQEHGKHKEKEKGKDGATETVEDSNDQNMKTKITAKCFEADLVSFQDLVNSESNPVPISTTLESLQHFAGGGNFLWERKAEWGNGYGASVTFSLQLILWYPNCSQPDLKSSISNTVSFLHKPGCTYIYQPVLPVTSLFVSPRSSFLPMFDMDPRSFHTFKLAWRHYLDFGVSDYRIIVGEQLEQWTQRLKAMIEKPLNAVYWLMLMVGSHYREELVQRNVLKGMDEVSERVPVICVDSFVSLSALLFSPERQILYAGTDPTPSYLQWLQVVADQSSYRKDPQARRRPASVFEMNEVMDLSVIIVFFGRIQMKVKESATYSWVGNPTLIKNYIRKYAEDNCCGSQLEQAVRLYSYSCALGEMRRENGAPSTPSDNEKWFCWNGLKVCEIGVPMPCTQATFLSPFITTKPMALFCPVHGPDAVRKAAERKAKEPKAPPADAAGAGSGGEGTEKDSSRRPSVSKDTRPGSRTSRRSVSSLPGAATSSNTPSVRDDSTKETSSDDEGSNSDEFDIFTESLDSTLPGADGTAGGRGGGQDQEAENEKQCSCARYAKMTDAERKGKSRKKIHGQSEEDPELVAAMLAVGGYDEMHCFASILAGALNHAKQILRTHFSIEPLAYSHLPMPGRISWPDGMIPWYHEFHRPDAHGRSRYGILLESVVRGLIGDGYTSGYRDEALDIIRATSQETVSQQDAEAERREREMASLQMKIPETDAVQSQKKVNVDVRRPSSLNLGPQKNTRTSSVLRDPVKESEPLSPGVQISSSTPSTTAPSTSSGVPPPPHSAPMPSKPGSQHKGVISELILWTELYECESIFNHRAHFDNFTQWCHSCHLVPFFKRVYRRCGVAGLLPGQKVGGLHVQGNPSYPLVLPTIPNFPYGHGFPLHRVLEYFYGGVTTIVCSITERQVTEEMQGPLNLIPGQEKLNNQCWFQLTAQEQEALAARVADAVEQDGRASQHGGNLNQMLLQQLENYISGRASTTAKKDPGVASVAGAQESGPIRGRSITAPVAPTDDKPQTPLAGQQASSPGSSQVSPASRLPNSRKSQCSGKLSVLAVSTAGGHSVTVHPAPSPASGGKRLTTNSVSPQVGQIGTLKKYEGKKQGDKPGKRKHARAPPKIGMLVPEDPFFWFCSQNYALHTYPADKIPKHFLPDGSCLLYRYTDFISRTGTPDPSHRHADQNHGQGSAYRRESSLKSNDDLEGELQTQASRSICRQVVPPAICLCQPTDLTSHNRQRWEVKLDYVDEQKIILGDSGWWPGALGNRFDYETQLENVDRYITASEVPQTRLLYIESVKIPRDAKAKSKGQHARGGDEPPDFDVSSSSDSDSDSCGDAETPAQRAVRMSQKKSKKQEKADTATKPSATTTTLNGNINLMLPPLLSTR